MEDFKAQKIKAAIKSILKIKKIGYEELAGELNCSLPTVKRILGPEDLTLHRLLQICRFLDVTLADLEVLGHEEEKPRALSQDQEDFLAKNNGYFAYLMKLYSGDSPKKIADKYHLTQRSTDKYLLGLEKQGFIRVTAKQVVKTASKTFPPLGRGVLAKAYFKNFITNAGAFFTQKIHESFLVPISKDASAAKGPGHTFRINTLKVTKATYVAWLEENNKAHENFARLAAFE